MNRHSSASRVGTYGSSWAKARYFMSGVVSAEDEEHKIEGNNQDDSDDGGDFNEVAAETSSVASSECSSFVTTEQATITAIRVRPMLLSEKKSGYRVIVDMSTNDDVMVTRIVNPTALPPVSRARCMPTEAVHFPVQFTQEFWFDYSYWSCGRLPAHQEATQSTIYDELGVLALQTVLQGRNCSVFAYGQPGAGKTYTMMGSGELTRANSNGSASERRGLIPRICQGLFGDVDERECSANSCTVLMSYVEIYDERVYDLLSQATVKQPLKIREHPENGAFVERAQRVKCTSHTQLLELIEEGNRMSSVTSMHKSGRPTRSHTVLTISLTQHEHGSEAPRKSKLCLVDLAGSERVDHSATSGSRLREASSVNRSLATLASVVGALAKRKNHDSQHQRTFAPYRNSVLTRLLKDCLGGRAKTIMVGVISPCCAHYEESIATLKCIERARSLHSTGRLQADASGNTALKLLRDGNELKSSLCASNEAKIPHTVDNEVPEHNDECPGCESCDDADLTTTQAPLEAKAEEMVSMTENNGTKLKQRILSMELSVERTEKKSSEDIVSLKSARLMNLVAIHHRWQSLRLCRAFDRWREFVSSDTKIAKWLPVNRERNKGNDDDIKTEGVVLPERSIGQEAGCPPLHTRMPTAETRTADRVHDVVAAVVATDAICCSVVQDFLFPQPPNSPLRQATTAASSLLEQLASSSEFDRPDFSLNNNSSSDEPPLEELVSPDGWDNAEESELKLSESGLSSYSPKPRDEESSIQSKLSLCLDSIDMARRALGPGVYSLKGSKMIRDGTGVECELLRYLDKRFIAMEWSVEDLMVAVQLHPLSAPLLSAFELLETMVGEFCMQIIPKLCDQLPSASSACVAGRHQLETQLDHFGYRLRRQLLPEITRDSDGSATNRASVDAVLFLATGLLVMTERIKIVWNLSGHKKRERLLQAQALEAAVVQNRKLAARIADLEERNAELAVKCSGGLDEGRSSANNVVAMEERLVKLQNELEEAHNHGQVLESQLVGCKRLNQEQNSELESVKQHLSDEKDARSKVEANLVTMQLQLDDLKHQLAHAEGRLREMEETAFIKTEERWENVNTVLMNAQTKNDELLASLSQANNELSCALEKVCRAETECNLRTEAVESLERSLTKAQKQRESAEMLAEDLATKHTALKDEVSIQSDQISVLEWSAGQDKHRLLELEENLAASVQESDERMLLLSQTEETLASALNREKVLQCQLVGSDARETEEMNRLRVDLHEATLELASLRDELAELLDHSTLQSSTIETLTLEQTETLQRLQDVEAECDDLVRQCQVNQGALEQETRAYHTLSQQAAVALSRLERQQESEREECMAVHEALQRQTIDFQKHQARQLSIKMDYYSTVRDLKGQVETLSTKSLAMNKELVGKAKDLDVALCEAEARIRKVEKQAKRTVREQEEIAYGLTEQLEECRTDLKASTSRWIRAETQSGVLRVCIKRLNCHLIETKEAYMMRLADTESSQLRDEHLHDLTQTEVTVNKDLSSLDAWFDEVISGNQEITDTLSTNQTSTIPKPQIEARDEERLSMMKTLTDLTILTNELLVVCESSPPSNNLSVEESDHAPDHHDTSKCTDDLEQELEYPQEANSAKGDCDDQTIAGQKEKALIEVIQLRKTVMKLKEALDAKDDMLLFLDGKIQLGGANDGLCHFLSFGGYEMLLDCGVKMQSLQKSPKQGGGTIYRLQLPALSSVDVGALDVVLLSNHQTLLALPFLTEILGFKGKIYATQLTLDFGRVFLEELAALNQGDDSAIFTIEGVTDEKEIPMSSLKEIEECCKKIQCVEYSEVVSLAYGVQITALSSGFSLGASIWLVEGPNDRLAYVAAASGDYNRHPKELDLLPLVDCDTLLLTDLKPDRDPHANTERMVERVLSGVSRVLERGGVCIVPTSPCGVVFDLVEALYTACVHNKQSVPMYFISDFASRVMELTQLGAEWLCEKKIEKLYAGEDAFLHESLLKSNLFHAVTDVSAATAATFQNGSIIFVGHPSLKFGRASELIQMLGNESRNGVLLIDPSIDATEAFAPFQDLPIEKISCPIDPRLSCGDANQFIARCCPHNLIVPYEYTVVPPASAMDGAEMSSHFSRVLPLHELTAAKSKTELLTFPMKQFEPIVVEKTSKYLDGRLDPKLAALATITEVNGKAAACVSGVLRVKRKAFVLEPPVDPVTPDVNDEKLKSTGKRKASSISEGDSNNALQSIVYKEKSNLLMGQVDEDKLEKQVKTHDPQAQVYISQGQGDADVFMSIPSLDARITLWKETGKTLVETEKEDARALLTSFILAQLVVITQG
ncbi:hypothetical protein F443_19177 [Phytophthora nicotianae P1569]|uniref:Kinesin motor domain-containing protein n=1 Tax=Phytophthora nicotianae P1569 TaxID=1317065 RepID=V9E5R2_PHYNI|nr:hypothetical protein F443_19177 [Phytophthora nicotianae P1569]